MQFELENSIQRVDYLKVIESRELKDYTHECSVTFRFKGEKGRLNFVRLLKFLDLSFTYKIVFKRKYPKRTIDQNSLLWLWMTALEHSSETGLEKWEFYQMFLEKYAPRKLVLDKSIIITSSHMSTAQFSKFLNDIQRDVETSVDYQMQLPDPNDRNFKRFYEYYKDKAWI